jgi:hypothetical protein
MTTDYSNDNSPTSTPVEEYIPPVESEYKETN